MQTFDLLFIFRHSPYGSSLGREGLEAALAAGAFDQDMAILFLDDGVWQLTSHQNTEGTGKKSHQKMASALPLFGIDKLYASADHLNARDLKLQALALAVEPLNASNIAQLIRHSKTVLSF